MSKKRILFAGESWTSYAIHTKGASSYTTSGYDEGATVLLGSLKDAGYDVTYLRNHEAVEAFPYSVEEISERFDLVVLSDLPADSLLLPHAVFVKGERRPNRLRSLTKFVDQGGGLLMIGGFMSFAGFEGRGRYAMTPLADVLPVEIARGDDRVEEPEGVTPTVAKDHAILAGIDGEWPYFLGYNQFKAKSGSDVLLSVGDDPFLVVGQHGQGRVAAFASDCSPHWGSPQFMAWRHYATFWSQLAGWLRRA
ncbi:glutamine amidotransferase [Mesorhizobium marinum]|uniref:glutamine amidotransferase n=1 Tax=Mesorhizobium marinum TaxID=3228790 RepID=UPI00346724B9